MISLRINGRPVQLPVPTGLLAYLEQVGINPRTVAVEINERILSRSELEGAVMDEGDVVEIVRMVGGG